MDVVHFTNEPEVKQALNAVVGIPADIYGTALTNLSGERVAGSASFEDREVVGEICSPDGIDPTLGNILRDCVRTGKRPLVLIYGFGDEGAKALAKIRETVQVVEGNGGVVYGIWKESGETKLSQLSLDFNGIGG